jgi:hypothetical protein
MKILVCVCCLMLLPIQAFAQGPLLWEVDEDISGGIDVTRAITLSGKTAVVVGNGGVPLEGPDESDLVIQALGRTTGAVKWTNQAFLSVGTIEPLFVATRNGKAYVVGTLRVPNDVRSAFLVRAYDVLTGALLWQNVWNAGRGVDTDHPTGIFATPAGVFVAGYSENATHDGIAAVIRAYDPSSGAIRWEDRSGSTGIDVVTWTIAANRTRVFMAGTTSPTSDPISRDLFVRAYDARSGAVLWDISRPSVTPTRLLLQSGLVIVAGSAAANTFIGAFAGVNGTVVWQDMTPTTGTVMDLAANGTRIAAAINSGSQFAVRVLDTNTGLLQWEQTSTAAPGSHEHLLAAGINTDTVFVAGDAGQDFGNSQFLVQAYDVLTGHLLWDDRSHSSARTTAVDLAVGKFRLFVAGYTTNSTTNADFLIRAYDIRPSTNATH